MRNLLEVVNEMNNIKFINESLRSSWLTKLMNCVKEKGIKASIKDFVNYQQIRWDKVTDEYYTQYGADDPNGIRIARRIIQRKNNGLILIIKNDNIQAVVTYGGFITFFYKSAFFDNKWIKKSWLASRQYEALEFLKDNDFVIYLFDKKNDPEHVIIDTSDPDSITIRNNRKYGIVLQGDIEYYANLARENVKRYKNIIAKNKANAFDKIGERVKAAVNGVMDLANKMEENPKLFTSTYVVEILLDKLYQTKSFDTKQQKTYGSNGLLYLWRNYLRNKKYSITSSSYNSMYYKDAKTNEQELLKLLDEIEETLKNNKV